MAREKSIALPFSAFGTVVVFALLICIGAALVPQLSVRLLPDRTHASLTVSARLPGASPETTELELATPLEAALSRLKGIAGITSVSSQGHCRIRLQLDKWTDPEAFRFEASALVRQLYPRLPAHASYPSVSLNRPDEDKKDRPLVSFTLSGPGTTNDIASYAEREIRPLANGIRGLHAFHISGARSVYQTIVPDVRKMRTAGVTVADLQDQLSQGFRNRELGRVATNREQTALFLNKGIRDAETLEDWPIRMADGRMFRLADIAQVAERPDRRDHAYRINGAEQVSLVFYAQEHVNTIRLANQIKRELQTFADRSAEGYALRLEFDQTDHIRDELGKIYLRTGLSVLVLLLFVIAITRNLRYLFIILAALAANVLLSVSCYYLFGVEIHLYSLAGVTISLGLVVDNAIVIVEDIRHTGRNRIFAAILASTLTALGALSVVFLLEEEQRLELADFAFAIIVNLLVSLPIAYFFIPALLQLFPVRLRQKRSLYKRKRLLVRFSRLYRLQLEFMVRRRAICLLLVVLAFGLPAFLLPTEIKNPENAWGKLYNQTFGSPFYNKTLREHVDKYLGGMLHYYIRNGHASGGRRGADGEERTQLLVDVRMPQGARFEQMETVCREFEQVIARYEKHLDLFTTNVYDPTRAGISVYFKKGVPSAIPHQLKSLLERQSILSGSADFAVHGIGRGFNNALNMAVFDSAILLKGYNHQQLQALAMIVRDSLTVHSRVSDIMLSSRREHGRGTNHEHVVRFSDPEFMALNRIGRRSMGTALDGLAERTVQVGSFAHPESGEDRGGLLAYKHLPLPVDDSTSSKFFAVSQIEKIRIGREMVRRNQEYLLYLNYRFIGTYDQNRLMGERIVTAITPLLPFGYKVEDTVYRGWGEGSLDYLWFVPLILLIIYMICAVLLESFRRPLAIIAMIPFSFIGVLWIFQLLDLRFDEGGYAALLMLSGLVTNAALYILNDLNFIGQNSRNARASASARFVKAFNAKAMPIVITTASAILSLLPFMLAGEEKGFWFTLSAGTIGGLLFSLLGSYFFLPLLLIKREAKQRRISSKVMEDGF